MTETSVHFAPVRDELAQLFGRLREIQQTLAEVKEKNIAASLMLDDCESVMDFSCISSDLTQDSDPDYDVVDNTVFERCPEP